MEEQVINRRIKNFKVGHPEDDQLVVEAYPKGKTHDRSDIDVLRLTLRSKDEGVDPYVIDMTPNEALEIAGALTNAAMFWLINYKPYWDTFMKRIRQLNRREENAIRRNKAVRSR